MSALRTRAGIAMLAGAALVLAGCGTTQSSGGDAADDYPTKAIQYIIPFDPGGESDITARLQQQKLEEILGVSVSVSNRVGGGGAIGWSELASGTKGDGYTIMGANLPHVVLQPLARDDAGYETNDIKWAYIFESTPTVLVVPKNSPYKTVEEFAKAAKDKKLTVGGSASFSSNHIAALALNKAADINLTYVPFSGTGSSTPALLGGQVDSLMTNSTEAPNLKKQGAKVLAVASEEPLEELPEAPTFTEAGFDVIQGAWRGVAVPPDTPDAITQKLGDAFKKVNNDPEVQKQMKDLGYHIENMGPEEAKEFTNQQKSEAEDLLKTFDLLKD